MTEQDPRTKHRADGFRDEVGQRWQQDAPLRRAGQPLGLAGASVPVTGGRGC